MPSKYRKEIRVNGERRIAHQVSAEKALGKPLPEGAVVHHHSANQLVICQDDTYHKLLHVRERAIKACGHAGWRKCKICKKYDDPANLYIQAHNRHVFHRECAALYQRQRKGA